MPDAQTDSCAKGNPWQSLFRFTHQVVATTQIGERLIDLPVLFFQMPDLVGDHIEREVEMISRRIRSKHFRDLGQCETQLPSFISQLEAALLSGIIVTVLPLPAWLQQSSRLVETQCSQRGVEAA